MSRDKKEPAPAWPLRRRVLSKLGAVLVVFAALAAVVLLAAVVPKRGADGAAEDPPPVNVKVLVVTPGDVPDTIDLHGGTEANRVVSVPAEVAGRIERILAEEGQDVERGQKIILLNTDLLQAEHDRSKAQLEFDRREVQRVVDAAKRRVATTMELDQARTRLSVSQAQHDGAKARLKRATIVAPIAGRLNRLRVEEGEYVPEGEQVAELVDLSKIKVVVHVPERDVAYLKLGGEGQIALDDGKLTGRITFIGELADEAARTTPVEITIENPQRQGPGGEVVRDLRSGRIVRVRLTRRTLPQAIMVPLQAVIPQENEKTVYVVTDGLAERRVVKLGFMTGWQVQVLSGLSAGERLIVLGHRFVAPGQAVRAETAETQPAPTVQADDAAPPRPEDRESRR